MTEQEIQAIIAERDYLWKKLQEEDGYREYVIKHRLKGYAGGYLTRCAGNYCIENQVATRVEKTKTELRKLANNPALSSEAKETLSKAAFMVEQYMLFRGSYFELLDSSEKLRKIEARKMVVKHKKETAQS